MLSELAVYLPDYQPEEPFEQAGRDDDESKGEPGFGGRVTISLKQIRSSGCTKFARGRQFAKGRWSGV